MKNSLTRLLQQHRTRNFTPANLQQNKAGVQGSKAVTFGTGAGTQRKPQPLPEELRSQIKA